MSFWEVFVIFCWLVWPIIIFESIREKYMVTKFKQLAKKVNVLSKDEYVAQDRMNTKKGNLLRALWILWFIFWTVELTFF
jgi:hypothetical protein